MYCFAQRLSAVKHIFFKLEIADSISLFVMVLFYFFSSCFYIEPEYIKIIQKITISTLKFEGTYAHFNFLIKFTCVNLLYYGLEKLHFVFHH